ncbi:Hypothetical predicted protein [Mytilus galloprovincialis]|uniref:DZIP3-like HEPN domain-containing protein n=1 Tax=Mytilus galloprovincialis TaxID=29158 RepID=A0A8B6EW77_MYTGA|nr:Hypothetical predicted protein [Mytilus galloprovincialis]
MMLSNITTSLTREESNYLRLAHLIIRVSPEAVRKSFDHHFNPGGLQIILMMNKAKIEVLFNKKIINQSQFSTLYPSSTGSSVSSSDMDATLMVCLLRNIAKIQIQDVLPKPSDTSECADLSRIKYYRNYVTHSSDGKLDDCVYSEIWKNVCETIGRLSKQTLKDECDALRFAELDCSLREFYMQICKTIEMEEKVKDLERELMHPIPKTWRDKIDQDMAEWAKDDSRYIKTSSMTVILEKIRNNSFVVITGSPGMGKTITARNICLKLRDIDGYTILPIREPAKILEYSTKEIKLLIFIDDFCGTFSLDQLEFNNWTRYYPQIIRCLSESTCLRVLTTCRFQVLKTRQLEIFLKKMNIIECNLLSEELGLSILEKSSIAAFHLGTEVARKLNIEKLKNVDMFPLLCMLYAKSTSKDTADNFVNPYEKLELELSLMRYQNEGGYLGLALLVLFNKTIPKTLLTNNVTLSLKTETLYSSLCQECKLSTTPTFSYVLACLLEFQGTYIKETESCIVAVHDKIFDIISFYVGKQILNTVLQHGDWTFVSQRVQLESINEKHCDLSILLPREYERKFFDRLAVEITNNKYFNVFCVNQLQHDSFQHAFLKFVSENEMICNIMTENIWPLTLSSLLGYTHIVEFIMLKRKNQKSNKTEISFDKWSDWKLINSFMSKKQYIGQYFNEIGTLGRLSDAQSFKTSKFEEWGLSRSFGLSSGHSSSEDDILNNERFDDSDDFRDFVNELRNTFSAPLLFACFKGHIDIVKLLVSYFDVNDVSGICSPIVFATSANEPKIVQILIEVGAKVNKFTPKWESPLCEACINGFIDIVEILLKNNADVNKHGTSTSYPLICACVEGHKDIVKLLTENSCDVNICDTHKRTALHIASKKGYEDIVEILLENKSDVNLGDRYRKLALHHAVSNNFYDIVDILVKHSSNINHADINNATPLYYAIKKNNTDIVSLLIQANCDVNATGENHEPFLHVAFRMGRLKIAKILIQNSCNLNLHNKKKENALHIAVSMNYEEIIPLLLEKNPNMNLRNTLGETALFIACKMGRKQMVKQLLEKCCNINVPNNNKMTPLFIASYFGHVEIANLLIQKGCNVNQLDDVGGSPFYIACQNNHIDIVNLLFTQPYTPDVNIQLVSYGYTPLIIASSKGHFDVVKILVENNCRIDMYDHGESTALKLSVKKGHKDIVRKLLKHNCDINHLDEFHKSPLLYAIENGFNDIVKELLSTTNCDVNIYDHQQMSALIYATERGNTEVVQLLLQSECNVNYCNGKNETALFIACKTGKNDIVKLLLNSKCDIDKCNNQGRSPLWISSANGFTDVAELLVQNGCTIDLLDNVGGSPFYIACQNYNIDIIYLLLRQDPKPDINIQPVNYSYTPLIRACIKGQQKIVELLIENNCNVNLYSHDHETALHWAAITGHGDIVRILIENECDVNHCDGNHKTALFYAVEANNQERTKQKQIVDLLLNNACDVNIQDTKQRTVLHYAVSRGDKDIVGTLLGYNCNVKFLDDENQSALNIAILKGYFDITQLILKADRTVSFYDQFGETAL